MPKEKEFLKLIPKIYRKNAECIMLFSWVKAQQQIVPTITIDQAIWGFFKFAHIDDWDIESARTTYARLQNDYYETTKKDC